MSKFDKVIQLTEQYQLTELSIRNSEDKSLEIFGNLIALMFLGI